MTDVRKEKTRQNAKAAVDGLRRKSTAALCQNVYYDAVIQEKISLECRLDECYGKD